GSRSRLTGRAARVHRSSTDGLAVACLLSPRKGATPMNRMLVPTLAVLATLTLAPLAAAQSDCTKLVPPSPFGPHDQTGATNRITPAVTKAAAAEIQSGKVVTMTYPLVDGVPLFGSRFTKTILTATGLAPGAALGENQLTYMEDTWLSQSHV